MALKGLFLFCIPLLGLAIAQPKKKVPVTQTIVYKQGKEVYKKVCLSCHMEDGGGVPRLNPPLINTTYVTGDKKQLIYIVLKGMKERVAIDDEYFSNNMASHAYLSDVEIAAVLTYVRNSFGNKASVVIPAEVKQVRAIIVPSK